MGERVPQEAQGRSFKALLEGQALSNEEIFSEGTGRGNERRAIISGDYKLIHDFFTGEDELYHLKRDKEEKVNLASVQPAIVANLKQRLFVMVEQARENRQQIFKQAESPGPPLGDVVGY